MRYRHCLSLSVLCFVLPVFSAVSEANSEGIHVTQDTEEVVITGTRTEQPLSMSPVKVEVISKDDIARMHAKDISEALQEIPGLQLKDVTGKAGKSAVLQGISANRVLVLVDGEPVTASTGSSVDLTQISATNVERIEIVKGATSALYGSAAMGGVINIITAQPEAGWHYQLTADAGTFGEANTDESAWYPARKRTDFSGSYTNDTVSIQGNINARISDGFSSGLDDWSQPGPDGIRLNTFLSGTWYATPDSEHTLSHEFYRQEDHTRYSESKGGQTFQQDKQDNATRNTYKYKSRWQWLSGDMRLSAVRENYENISSPIKEQARKGAFTYSNAGFQLNQDLDDWQTLTMGMDVSMHGLDQVITAYGKTKSEVPDETRKALELYVQDHIKLDRVSLLPGVRWQRDSDFGSQLTPKINARYDIAELDAGQVFLRGGVGKGYRVPNLKERFYLFDHSELGYMLVGNPDLQPEQSVSYQLGLGAIKRERYQFDINVFFNDLSNLIELQPQGVNENGISIYQYKNFEKARTQGVELNGQYQFTQNIKIQLGYSYLDAKDLITGFRLNSTSRHQAKAQLHVTPIEDWELSFRGQWQSNEVSYEPVDADFKKLTSPAWGQLDLKLNHTLTSALSVYAGVDNFTNTRKDYAADYDNRPTQGRMVYLGITLKQ